MAIGVRISSINLSGDTANVTFLPTSGGTINLGTQTIPFNNITPNYEGTYQLFVPQYGYTYEIVVGASTITGQTFAFLSSPTGSTNWGVAVNSFIDMTAQVIDLDVDKSGWYESSWYPLTESGFGILFNNRDNGDYKKLRFIDTVGNLMGEHNCYTTNYNFNYTAGKIIYFNDHDNGILKYFDGYQVYTLTSDTANQYVNVLNDYDGVTSLNTFGISISDTNTNIHTNYIVSGGSLTQYSTLSADTYNQNNVFYYDGSFIAELTYLNSGGVAQTLNIYDGGNGSVLQTYDFTTGSTYNSWNIYPYGNNKLLLTLWDNSQINTDWLFIQYDGNTDILNTLFHVRGTNYQSISVSTQDNYNPNNSPSEAWIATIYNSDTNLNFGSRVNYCDLIYMLSGDTSIQTYVYQNSGLYDKIFYTYPQIGNLIASYGDTGNGLVSVFSINQSGFTVTATTISSSINGYGQMIAVGEGFVFQSYHDNYSADTLVHINRNGEFSDMISEIPRPSGSNWDNQGSLFVYSNNAGVQYYINDASDLFQTNPPLPFYNNTNISNPNSYVTNDFLRPSIFTVFDYTTYEIAVLSSTGFTSTVQLPNGSSGYNLELGKDKFMYTYRDSSWIMNLYDYDLNLLNSYDTYYYNSWGSNALKDRFIQIFSDGNEYTSFGISPTGVTQSVMSQADTYNGFNDSISWC